MLQSIFYITGIIFFIIVIVACAIFIYKVTKTSNMIKKVLTSKDIEDLIIKIKNGVDPLIKSLGL